jgi:hypothetical protein
MPTLATNIHVVTPYGPGIIQGRMADGWLVRVTITDANRDALSAANCKTPRASRSGLWVIKETEMVK